jgi:hypothetical protein
MALTCPFMNRAISTPGILDICGSLAVYLELDFFHSTLRKLKFLIAVPETGFAVTAWGGQFGPFRLHQQHLKLYGAKDARNSSAI